jgi:hypothetical protein
MQDDYHHFRVRIAHDRKQIVSVDADAFRHPWDLCARAPSELAVLAGMPLRARMSDLNRAIDARLHCTHLLDLSALMIGLINRGVQHREYQIEIPYRVDQKTSATLKRDGREILRWSVEGDRIVSPEPYTGRDIGRGFVQFADAHFDAEGSEAALVLRRAVFVSHGRGTPLDDVVVAPVHGVCFVQNAERGPSARRLFQTRLDFTHDGERLGRDDDDWLEPSGH